MSYVDGIVTMDVWRNSAQLLLLFGRSVIRYWAATKFCQARHDVCKYTLAVCISKKQLAPSQLILGPEIFPEAISGAKITESAAESKQLSCHVCITRVVVAHSSPPVN